MRISYIIASLTLVSFIFFSSCNTTYALDENIGFARIDPSSPIYFLKTIRESIELKLAGTPQTKIIRQMEFATRRLREAKSLVGSLQEELIQATLERYWHSINQVLSVSPKEKELSALTNHVVWIHLKELLKLYPKLENKNAKMGVRATINRLMQNSDLDGEERKLGCSFLLSESSSSALNQSEQVIYKERAEACFRVLPSPK